MSKKTEIQKFRDHLKTIGFETHEVMSRLHLVPSYYKTHIKDHFIASSINVCIFQGADTKEGDIGCVTLSYRGKLKAYRCRSVNDGFEMLKKVFIPKNADEAIEVFTQWHSDCQEIIKGWKKIL